MSQTMYLLVYKPEGTDPDIDFEFLKQRGIEIVDASNMKSMIDIMREREAAAVMAFYESEEGSSEMSERILGERLAMIVGLVMLGIPIIGMAKLSAKIADIDVRTQATHAIVARDR